MSAIEVIAGTPHPVGNGEYTFVLESGEVLSVQPDGSFQTRPAGTAGPWERYKPSGTGGIFRPQGAEGKAYFVPLATDWPNR